MSDSDTGETSRFKIKRTEPVTNVEGTTNSGDNSHNDYNQTPLTAVAQKADKHKKRKNKRKREPSPESLSSNSENSSYSEDSVEEASSTKSHRCKITSQFASLCDSLRVFGNFLVKWEIMSIIGLSFLFQKKM